jgi:pilus assembly protein Flp/PilA
MSDLMLKLYTRLQTLRTREDGQGMVEYGLLLALISVAAIAFLPGLGTKVADAFSAVEAAIP